MGLWSVPVSLAKGQVSDWRRPGVSDSRWVALSGIATAMAEIEEQNDFLRWDRSHIWIAIVVYDAPPAFHYQWIRQAVGGGSART